MATEKKVVGFARDQFVQGGLVSNVDVLVTSARWADWNYGGTVKADEMAIAVHLQLKDLANDEEYEEYISAGKAGNVKPDSKNDNRTLVVVQGEPQLRKGSNFDIFMDSLCKQGWPATANDPHGEYSGSDGDVSRLDGLKFHLMRVPAPERAGLKRNERKKDFEPTVITCSQILQAPWEKSAKGSRSTKAASASSGSASDSTSESNGAITDAQAGEMIKTLLAASNNKIPLKSLNVFLLRHNAEMAEAERKAYIEAINRVAADESTQTELGFALVNEEIRA